MTIDSLDRLSALIEEKLTAAEENGLEREAVADLLEEHAAAVRNGHTELPENRGEWWHDVNSAESDETRPRVAAESDD